ncbi:N-acetyltransferase [Bradyrhizobium brasilense]|uniref:GNAT family N-acetyltransferase n=1 Tax=Bradyrhizobium brasilense TaxID=1419277 RepID=UPI00145754D2|nr:N-acetyltransferase [Bradyrhizobium brasilense]
MGASLSGVRIPPSPPPFALPGFEWQATLPSGLRCALTFHTITTARLTLRPQAIDEFPADQAFLASLRSAGMGGSIDVRAAWGMFCHDLACWRLFGHGALMIEVTASKQCVGQVGINHGPLFPEQELGWLLYDGQGYATEAALALRNWTFAAARSATASTSRYFEQP